MTVEEELKGSFKTKKNVLVGIKLDSHSCRDLLNWAIVKIADPGDSVIAIHVCQSSGRASSGKCLLDCFLEGYEGLCNVNKVQLTGKILAGSSVRKVLVREAKNHDHGALVLGISKPSTIGGWSSLIKYYVKKLPPKIDVLAIYNGKIVFRKYTNYQLPGMNEDPKPSINLTENLTPKLLQSSFAKSSQAESEKSSVSDWVSSENNSQSGSAHWKDEEVMEVDCGSKKFPTRTSSLTNKDPSEQKLGWPLLRRTTSMIPQPAQTRDISVVQWVMSLPDRSPQASPRCLTIKEDPFKEEMSVFVDENEKAIDGLSALREPPEGLECLLKLKGSSNCKWFSSDVLKASTSQFSSENLIGKGGCNRVYKGILPDGKLVAVKVLNSSKESWKEFAREIDIISSLKHKHVAPLLGICIENDALISVYEFFAKGSLEENLQGSYKDDCILSWDLRFNVAVRIAEALNYLHNEHSKPVIHRDVKSSNILLTDEFEPQLSDFGLSIWGPTSSSFRTEGDVVGTFGYLAPEYFMYGKVSDKIDVYAFGIVLLELLSGRKSISSEMPKGQESLVMWAKPIIESGDIKRIIDPNLDGNFDEVQMQRMVLGAALCITRAARLRPKMSQILKLLKGEEDENDIEKWMNSVKAEQEDSTNLDNADDEVYPNSSAELHLSLALLDMGDDDSSFSSGEQRNSLSLDEYFKQRRSRSSSFN